ncbi:uncharacterized protein LOC130783969 [Actinidia eriantha]|uniref:uncharacterized protein LOC130783108 n=1 Tax=Actinidia eriantha TaxID=165200 RepID=UPI002585C381|nr:uncharacterized protein LOC130783108 [Actinidia eriantha]XP_057499766.1 uncharacterized protein LOC130783969 [Actinidia eriantha]
MEISTMEKLVSQMPQKLSPSSSGRRRRSGESNSPEFEFWMVRNPSCPQPKLLSADELFVDGVLLPLQLLPLHPQPLSDDPPDCPNSQTTPISDPSPNPDPKSDPDPGPGTDLPALGSSKRWRDIFKKSDKIRTVSQPSNSKINEDKEKEKKKERKASGGGGGGSSSAELNINIWPFSRSRSAGNGGNRPKMTAGSGSTRKVSSAPCSRSNSAGESKSRKWPSSPSRVGVHLGRSSPVWQVRRPGYGLRSSDPVMVRNNEKGVQKEGNETGRKKPPTAAVAAATGGVGGTKAKGLNLNVPMCIGYRQHLSCRSDESSAFRVAAVGGRGDRGCQSGGSSDGGRGGHLFNLRGFFTKKVY